MSAGGGGGAASLSQHNKAFRYNYALVCCIPNSFSTRSSTKRDQSAVIDLEKARNQHFQLVDTLRKLGISILQLPADEKYPDCVFVEDCAVCINGTALICKPAVNSRTGEVAAVRQALKRDLGLKIVEVDNEKATVEGGDILWTGREIIVGLSSRTNLAGAIAVSKAFPEYNVSTVKVPERYLHLKNVVSMGGVDLMIVSVNKTSAHLLSELKSKVEHPYKIIRVEDDAAVSTMYANGL